MCAYLAGLPADADLPHALVEIASGPGYRGSPFINAAAEYADPDHPVRRLIRRHRRTFRELLVALPAVSARPDPRAAAGPYLALCDGLVAFLYLDAGTDR